MKVIGSALMILESDDASYAGLEVKRASDRYFDMDCHDTYGGILKSTHEIVIWANGDVGDYIKIQSH